MKKELQKILMLLSNLIAYVLGFSLLIFLMVMLWSNSPVATEELMRLFGGPLAILGVAGYLTKELVSQNLQKDLVDYKQQIDQRLYMFTEFHKRRPDIFLEACQKLSDVHESVNRLLNYESEFLARTLKHPTCNPQVAGSTGTTPLTKEHVRNELTGDLIEKVHIAKAFFLKNRIFIEVSDDINKDIGELILKVGSFIGTDVGWEQASQNPQWEEARIYLKDEFTKKIRSHENYFRDILLGQNEPGT